MFANTLGMKLRAAYLSMHRTFQAQFSCLGVTADQFVVLSHLADEDGLIQRELVRRTCSDANTIAALLRLLERGKLVRRVRDGNDGRARRVFLTGQGRRLQRRLTLASEHLHRDLQDVVAPDELPLLLQWLEEINTTMAERRPAGRRTIATTHQETDT